MIGRLQAVPPASSLKGGAAGGTLRDHLAESVGHMGGTTGETLHDHFAESVRYVWEAVEEEKKRRWRGREDGED